MCTKTGRIITVKQANIEAEQEARDDFNSNHYVYYWRTNRGVVRQKGYVWECACGKFQRFARTKREAETAIKIGFN